MADSKNRNGARRASRWLLLTVVTCHLFSCRFLDHPTSPSLQRELGQRSKNGLAVARWESPGASLGLRFFDGRTQTIGLGCCGSLASVDISRSRILALSRPAASNVDFMNEGGQVVVMNAEGKFVSRSELTIVAGAQRTVALSPDETRFAFVGKPCCLSISEVGIYVAGFHDAVARKLMSLGPPPRIEVGKPPPRIVLDWSPHGDELLLSRGGVVLRIDVRTGHSRKVADGAVALWSPTGDWISYADVNFEPALLNVTTGESKPIDREHGTGSPLEWSPEGEYLLIVEGRGSHVPYGSLWVYRISDSAFAHIPDSSSGGPAFQWIQVAHL